MERESPRSRGEVRMHERQGGEDEGVKTFGVFHGIYEVAVRNFCMWPTATHRQPRATDLERSERVRRDF